MPIVVGIRFKDSGKTYHFDPQQIQFESDDWVIVETVRGPELGRVAMPPTELAPDQLVGELKPVLRRATDSDLAYLHQLQEQEAAAIHDCSVKVREHALPMNLVKAEYNFDGSRLTFYFTAERRVDFRALVRDLARTFRTRIELRQIGPRDEAKLLGGIGPCGRALCCATFLPDFARVSIKMAKDQDLPLTPSKISGVCGRLLCCLSYEHDQYLEIKAELPERGDWVQTPHGPGDVVAVNVVKENVTVELTDGNTVECSAAQILEVRRRVATEAQARTSAGISPAAQYGLSELETPDEVLASDDPHLLQALEDTPPSQTARPSPARLGQPVRPAAALGEAMTHTMQSTPARRARTEPPPADRSHVTSMADAGQRAAPLPPPSDTEENAPRRRRRKRNGKG